MEININLTLYIVISNYLNLVSNYHFMCTRILFSLGNLCNCGGGFILMGFALLFLMVMLGWGWVSEGYWVRLGLRLRRGL